MTAHLHAAFVDGCYRCDISRDEVAASLVEEAREALEAHKAVCRFQSNPGDRRSGSNVCGTCWSLTNQLVAAEHRAGEQA